MRTLFAASLVGVSLAAAPASADHRPDLHSVIFEIHYLVDMLDHHAGGLAIAELCVERAEHDELRHMCAEMAEAHQEELAQLQQWLRRWYRWEHEPRIRANDRYHLAHLECQEGEAFDHALLDVMIPHHAGAVEESEHCLDRAWHHRLLRFCEHVVEAQSHEIEHMEHMRCEHFGECPDACAP